MRLHSLLALAAAGIILMPLAANAGKISDDKRGVYMDECIRAATAEGLDVNAANQHCKCGRDALEKNFTDKEIAALDTNKGVDAQLMQRAQTAVRNACAAK